MLRLGDDWTFEVDPRRSTITLSPKGLWTMSVVCSPTKVRSMGLSEELAPRLKIAGMPFDGQDWRDFVGLEVYQEGAWRGDGDPEASLHVVQSGDLYEARVRIVGHEGTHLNVEIDATCDIFFDDGHDTDVPLRMSAAIPFEGVRFRFRSEGADSQARPEDFARASRGVEGRCAFAEPDVTPLRPGVFTALFPPSLEYREEVASTVSAEVGVLHQSAAELLAALVAQGWLELEGEGVQPLVADFVQVMEQGGAGPSRAGRVVDWLIERDEVADVHCTDDDLARVLDKWW